MARLEEDDYIKRLAIPDNFSISREQLARLIQVVEKYSREHTAGHLTEQACLFDMGSEREVLMEDDLWAEDDPEDLIHATASLLWHLGFSLNHGVED